MDKRDRVEVNEKQFMQAIAGEAPLLSVEETQIGEEEKTPKSVNDESINEEVITPVKIGKKKNARQIDFEGTFLKEAKITDRRQMYINGKFYDKISAYLRIISEGKVSMVGYVHNVLAYHMQEFKDEINEMYKNRISQDNPL